MTDHNEDNQSNSDNNNNNNNNNSDSDDEELATERIGELRRAQQRLLTEIAQSTQDASDELRLMNDNIENLTREVRGTKEAIKSLTDMLRKYLDKKSE
jgi:phage host-nuclease inhibitor protein Gam